MQAIRTLALALGFWGVSGSSPANADNWLFVQTNVFPSGCESLVACIDSTTDERRNLMEMSATETMVFLSIIDELSEVQDVPPIPDAKAPPDFPLSEIVPRLQVIEVQGKVDALRGLPGVYFDANRVSGEGLSDEFTAYFTDMLNTAGIPILTEEQARAMPGAARMSVSLSMTRDNAGCILPFRASLSIKEEVVLVRDPTIKLETTTWSVNVAENFANTNYVATAALRDAAQQFIVDYGVANEEPG